MYLVNMLYRFEVSKKSKKLLVIDAPERCLSYISNDLMSKVNTIRQLQVLLKRTYKKLTCF